MRSPVPATGPSSVPQWETVSLWELNTTSHSVARHTSLCCRAFRVLAAPARPILPSLSVRRSSTLSSRSRRKPHIKLELRRHKETTGLVRISMKQSREWDQEDSVGARGPETRNSIQAIAVLRLLPSSGSLYSESLPVQLLRSRQRASTMFSTLLPFPPNTLSSSVTSPEAQRLTWLTILGSMPLSSLFSLLLTETWTRPHFPFALIITAPMYVSWLRFPLAARYRHLVYQCLLLFLFFSFPSLPTIINILE